jgi:hypothetical protein
MTLFKQFSVFRWDFLERFHKLYGTLWTIKKPLRGVGWGIKRVDRIKGLLSKCYFSHLTPLLTNLNNFKKLPNPH